MKALARSTSPMSSSFSDFNRPTPSAQRTFSSASARVSRCARSSFSVPRSTSSIACCFSALAALNSAVSLSRRACSSATFAWLAARRELAAARRSLAALSAARLGSTVMTMSRYMTRLMTQAHRPAAAWFLPEITSTVKCSLARYGRTSFS